MVNRLLRGFTFANVCSFLALTVALGTGTAYAANTIGSDDIIDDSIQSVDIMNESLLTSDIKNGQVKVGDLATNAVTSVKVLDESLTSADLAADSVNSTNVLLDSLTSGDLATDSVGSSEIQTDAVQGAEIANNSIGTGEIVDFGLSNQDLGVLFAQINADATVANSSGGVTAVKLAGLGGYSVDFGRNISGCAFVATIGPAGTNSAAGEVNASDRFANVEAVFVDTNTSTGASADLPFQLVVVC